METQATEVGEVVEAETRMFGELFIKSSQDDDGRWGGAH